MALSDSAEYWFDRGRRHFPKTKKTTRKPCTDHHPKDVPDGTAFKWFCPNCGEKINKGKYLTTHGSTTEKG